MCYLPNINNWEFNYNNVEFLFFCLLKKLKNIIVDQIWKFEGKRERIHDVNLKSTKNGSCKWI